MPAGQGIINRGRGIDAQSASTVVNPTILTPTLPTVRDRGDVLLCLSACRLAAASLGAPAGWTTLLDVAGTNGHIYVGGRIVDGAESNPTVTWTGVATGVNGDSSLARISCVGGLYRDLAGIVDATGSVGNTTGTASLSVGGGITTVKAGSLILAFCCYQDDAGNVNAPVNLPESLKWTIFDDLATVNGNDMRLTVWSSVLDMPGAVGAKTEVLAGGTNANSTGVMLSLRADDPSFQPSRMPIGV